MKKLTKFRAIGLLFIIIILGCPNPSSSDDTETNTNEESQSPTEETSSEAPLNPSAPEVPINPIAPDVPLNFSAHFNSRENTIDLSWDRSGEGLTYEVFRVNNSSEVLISNQSLNSLNISDSSFPLDSNLSYKVRSYSDSTNLHSDFTTTQSIIVNITDIKVKNLKSTLLEYDNLNRVVWDSIDNVGLNPVYEVYRYSSKPEISMNPPLEGVKLNSSIVDGPEGTKYIEDVTALPKTPYYYQVKWKDLNVDTGLSRSGLDSDYVFGIYVNIGNENSSEPNDDYLSLPYNTTFLDMTDLFIFKNRENKDIDSFKINVAPNDVSAVINVTVKFDPSFNGKLKYEYIYNNEVKSTGFLRNNFPNYFSKGYFTNTTSTTKEDVYFRITPTEDLECTYSISYSESYSPEY